MTTAESIVMKVFHGLQHYKVNLCDKCGTQVTCVSLSVVCFTAVTYHTVDDNPTGTDNDILQVRLDCIAVDLQVHSLTHSHSLGMPYIVMLFIRALFMYFYVFVGICSVF